MCHCKVCIVKDDHMTWVPRGLPKALLLRTQNRHPKLSSPCKSNCKGVKAMQHSIGDCFFSSSSGDGAAYADGLYLSPWVCDLSLSRHAARLARAASSHFLLAGMHASRAPGATHLGRDDA